MANIRAKTSLWLVFRLVLQELGKFQGGARVGVRARVRVRVGVGVGIGVRALARFVMSLTSRLSLSSGQTAESRAISMREIASSSPECPPSTEAERGVPWITPTAPKVSPRWRVWRVRGSGERGEEDGG